MASPLLLLYKQVTVNPFFLIFLRMGVQLNLEPFLLPDVELPPTVQCLVSQRDAIRHRHTLGVVILH